MKMEFSSCVLNFTFIGTHPSLKLPLTHYSKLVKIVGVAWRNEVPNFSARCLRRLFENSIFPETTL